ncbi:hypothetical protein HK405_005266, partial [Cladochytrium tenue]
MNGEAWIQDVDPESRAVIAALLAEDAADTADAEKYPVASSSGSPAARNPRKRSHSSALKQGRGHSDGEDLSDGSI